MSRIRLLRTVIQLAVGAMVLALGLRTWVIMGLIGPVVVAGSSMAPGLRGEHVTAECGQCGHRFGIGAEFVTRSDESLCSVCRSRVSLAGLPRQGGDRLWIDRTAYLWRQPRRWDVVVARSPADGSLCIKRIAGLPGESVRLDEGDLWIDGVRQVKSLPVLRRLCSTVLRQDDQHLLSDANEYNATLSRQLNLVSDWFMALRCRVRGAGELKLQVETGSETLQVLLSTKTGQLALNRHGHTLQQVRLARPTLEALIRESVLLEVSTCDRQFLLAIDGHVQIAQPLDSAIHGRAIRQPLVWETRGIEFVVESQTLARDIFYMSHPVGAVAGEAVVTLGEDEYYLLGDNSPVSLDSRVWGSVSGKLLIGQPVGVR